jgi:tellurite resistance protein
MPAAPRVSERRPPRFPPPQFPPHRPKLFATTPPAIFGVILGLQGLVLAFRLIVQTYDLPFAGLVEVLAGAVLGLWVFAIVALKAKVIRRPGVLAEDMRPIPGRTGLAAATMTGMAAGALLMPFAHGLGVALILASVVAHAAILVVLGISLRAMPAEARGVNPGLHLALVGWIVAGSPLAQAGYVLLASVIFWSSLVAASAIWVWSALDMRRHSPPAPLRPMLAIHMGPAGLLSITALALGWPGLATLLAALSVVMAVALLIALPWILEAGFSPAWGAFTFPLISLAVALLHQGGLAADAGLVVTAAAAVLNPVIAWRVLKLWPGGRLAQKTGAAEA